MESFVDNGRMEAAQDLNDVRDHLLDLITAAKKTAVPDTRARMIRLQAEPVAGKPLLEDLSNLVVEPVALVCDSSLRQITLSQNGELTIMLGQVDELIDQLEGDGFRQVKDWRVLCHNTTAYEGGRIVYKCLAIRIMPEQIQRNRDI